MKKILVFGRSGAGKSFLATRLGKKLNLPVFHLDKYYWLPGWIARPKTDHSIEIEKLLRENTLWIMDGNYKKSALEPRIRAADLIIMLDFGVWNCLYRAIKRNLIHYNKTRPDMQDGCKEKLFPDVAFLSFIWHQRKTTVLPILEILKNVPDKKVIVLRNQKEVERWLRDFPSIKD